MATSADNAKKGQTLYNGIVLPATWPPVQAAVTRNVQPVPYLKNPPAVIPIDVGRQLFVDDFLVQDTTLARTHHQPEYYAGNPVLKPDRPWEVSKRGPIAMPFSDLVAYDPAEKIYKMWYLSAAPAGTCYATSRDGLTWEKPLLDVLPGTNAVHTTKRDSGSVFLDLEAKDPNERYKMILWAFDAGPENLMTYLSADGIHWRGPITRLKGTGDRTTAFYNPFRKVWVFSIRAWWPGEMGRGRFYVETPEFTTPLAGLPQLPWLGADVKDLPYPGYGVTTQLYNHDAAPYESLMIGMFSIWHGDSSARNPKNPPKMVQDFEAGRPKINVVKIGYSRDGYHWYRPDRRPFMNVAEKKGDWNWGNVQSIGGGCLIVGDKLYLYFSGRGGKGFPGNNDHDHGCCVGLAMLRRDGFASMDAGAAGGELTTRPVTFKGKHLFVNVDCPGGKLSAEVIGPDNKPLPGFTLADCTPVTGDTTCRQITWKGGDDLSKFAGQPVRFRFQLAGGGKLYAFWVSPEKTGASHGYVAAGGPGFTGPTDTVGAVK